MKQLSFFGPNLDKKQQHNGLNHWCQGEFIGMRLMDGDTADPRSYIQNALRFDDGGMKTLAAAVVWVGLVYYVMTLKDEELLHQSIVELARQLLQIPTYYKTQGDESMDMIRRIIKQNVDAKKQAVSSYEWSMILTKLTAKSSKASLSLQDAIDLYNNNPEVSAHGMGTGKDHVIAAKMFSFKLFVISSINSSNWIQVRIINRVKKRFGPKISQKCCMKTV